MSKVLTVLLVVFLSLLFLTCVGVMIWGLLPEGPTFSPQAVIRCL